MNKTFAMHATLVKILPTPLLVTIIVILVDLDFVNRAEFGDNHRFSPRSGINAEILCNEKIVKF